VILIRKVKAMYWSDFYYRSELVDSW
jgi:hypothetical protein